jgi:hypothetical protein
MSKDVKKIRIHVDPFLASRGKKGKKGHNGAQGPQGAAGADGADGISGIIGLTGGQVLACGATGVFQRPSTTNGWLALGPTGTGFLCANVPDGSVSGGECRGYHAVDWQNSREYVYQVAKGNYSVISGGHNNVTNALNSFIGGGVNNQITNYYNGDIIVGGNNNIIYSGSGNNHDRGNNSFIGGGTSNLINNWNYNSSNGHNLIVLGRDNKIVDVGSSGGTSNSFYNSVMNGRCNTITSNTPGSVCNIIYHNNIFSGYNNNLVVTGVSYNGNTTMSYNSIVGGNANRLSCTGYATKFNQIKYSNIINGHCNFINATLRDNRVLFSTISNGFKNNINPSIDTTVNYGSILNGYYNKVNDNFTSIINGYDNITHGNYSTIVNGMCNRTNDNFTSIINGYDNITNGNYSTIVNGICNRTNALCASIVGGKDNRAIASYTFIGGGHNNTASGVSSFIGGGQFNQATGSYSVVVGGSGNKVFSNFSSIIGGRSNKITAGSLSVACGYRAEVNHSGCFIFGDSTGTATPSYANNEVRFRAGGDFTIIGNTCNTGNLNVVGTLTKGAGAFMIDHPVDPFNKLLYHSFVESNEMKNIYDGMVNLDENGNSGITLPDWFTALNTSFRYQLTPIGSYAPLFVSQKISDNDNDKNTSSFKISGGLPFMEVSWQVTGVRKDKFALKYPITVEVEKLEKEKGTYLHPELF